ncbi:hypothetical protein JL722_13936 [Aureococcus anophagefferens]|nr:hypothetical protein JL722_13936 [Aureococcus anophagefferens]
MPCALSVASSEPGGLHRAAAALVRLLAAATTSDDVTLWVRGRRAARATVEGASLGLAATAAGYATSANATAWVADAVELRWPRQLRGPRLRPRDLAPAVAAGRLRADAERRHALGEPPGAAGVAAARRPTTAPFRTSARPYALSVGNASKDVSVARCRFASLAGGAIKLGNVDDARRLRCAADRDAGFTVADNVVRDVALEFRGAAAIFAAYVRAATIEHNAISNTGYTAVSLGWGWGTHVAGTQTWMADNHVVGNRIAGVVSALNDGGCVDTLGPQPGSTVRGNYCDSDRAPVVGSFYHDNGSRYFNTTDNVASASPAPCLFLQGCCGAPALDIAVSGVWCRNEGAVRNDCAAGAANCSAAYAGAAPADCGCRVDDVAVVDPGAPWPAAARAVIAQASRSASTSPPMDSPRDASDCAEPARDRQPAEPLRLLLVRRMESRLSDSR